MDVLLANAGVKARSKHSRQTPPLGLAYIASLLIENNYSVGVQDFNVMSVDTEQVTRSLEQWAPRVMGISVNTETYPNGLWLAGLAKKVNPEMTVVMGGPHASPMFREVLNEQSVDIVVRGEGEHAMLELADYFVRNSGHLAQIKGIAFKKDGRIETTPERPFLEDPDSLPFPARELFPLPFYKKPASVLVSRGGCPFACSFCAVNNIWKGRRVYRKPEKVLDEIDSIINTGIAGEINFADDALTLNRERILELCDLIKLRGIDARFNWGCSTRVDLVDDELLQEMHAAGCRSIQYGIETASQKIMDSIGKKTTIEKARESVEATLEYGIAATCSFMFPHPEDTVESIQEQSKFMKELVDMGAEVSLALTAPFPGTDYYEHRDDLGIRLLTREWDEFDAKHLIIETKYLNKNKLEHLLGELINYVNLQTDAV